MEQKQQSLNKKFLISIFFLFLIFELLFLTTRHQDIHWDEAVYISMGKWLYSTGEQGLFESIRPLGLPLILGFLWKLHLGTVMSYQLVIFLFAVGVLYLTWRIAETLFDNQSALFSLFFLAITPFFLLGSFSILTEVPTTFFILLTVYFLLQKKHPFLIGISASMAFLFKFPAGLLFLAIVLLYALQSEAKELLRRKSPLLFTILGFLVVQLPFLVFNYFLYNQETTSWFDAVLRPLLFAKEHAQNYVNAVPNFLHNLFYYPLEIFLNNPLLCFSMVSIFFLLFQKEERKKASVLLIPLCIFLLYFTAIANKQLRFAILFLPFIAIFAGEGVFFLLEKVKQRLQEGKKEGIILLLVMGGILVYPNILLVYHFFPAEILPIETEYYSFFSAQNKTGRMLTTESYFSAHSDGILAIPYYNNVTDAREIYEKYKTNVDYIVWTTDFYPCTEEQCKQELAALEEDIVKNNDLLYEKAWNGRKRTIWSVR